MPLAPSSRRCKALPLRPTYVRHVSTPRGAGRAIFREATKMILSRSDTPRSSRGTRRVRTRWRANRLADLARSIISRFQIDKFRPALPALRGGPNAVAGTGQRGRRIQCAADLVPQAGMSSLESTTTGVTV